VGEIQIENGEIAPTRIGDWLSFGAMDSLVNIVATITVMEPGARTYTLIILSNG
jgi:hypothetical protein